MNHAENRKLAKAAWISACKGCKHAIKGEYYYKCDVPMPPLPKWVSVHDTLSSLARTMSPMYFEGPFEEGALQDPTPCNFREEKPK